MDGGSAALRETAYAKVNLALHVRRRLPDGYHEIETLFAFCEDGDLLSATTSSELSLSIDGPFAFGLAADGENLVMRAAQALREATGFTGGAALRLTKSLPVAAGIGGGSSDAAATLRLLQRLWRIELDRATIGELCARLGADVPACLTAQTSFGHGRGDQVEPVSAEVLSGTPALLVNPREEVPTGPVFAAWGGIDRGALDMDDPVSLNPDWRNDLEQPAIAKAPVISAVLSELGAKKGVSYSRMSGSGATCFALFESEADRDLAAAELAVLHRDWWILPTRLR